MRRVLKWLGVGVAGLFGLAVLGYGVLLVINWSDEPLSETAQTYLAHLEELREPPLEGNGFFYLAGISAAEGEDPWDLAREWRDWSHLPWPDRLDVEEPQGPVLEMDFEWLAGVYEYSDGCRTPDAECINLLETEYEAVRQGLAAAELLLDRYDFLMGLSLWQEDIVDDPTRSYVMVFGAAISLGRLNGMRAWVLAREGETDTALALLEREASFWRDVLAEKSPDEGKWLVPIVLRNNALWTNRILSISPNAQGAEIPTAWRRPLTQAERDLRAAHAMRVSTFLNWDSFNLGYASLWDRLKSVAAEPLFQPAATANRLAEYYAKVDAAMRLTYPEIRQALDEIAAENREQFRLFRAYNPTGNTLYGISTYSYVRSIWFGVNDLEGARRALLLTHELRTEGVAPEDVAAYLEDASLRDPYTGEAFTWDAEAGAISYQGMGRRPYSFPLAYPGI